MKFLTKDARPGHQKSHSRMAFMQKMPMWPEEGEECKEWRSEEQVVGGTYI